MLGWLRAAHAVRAVSCLAALLSLGGSLGLHPEPGPAGGGPPVSVFGAPTPGVAGSSIHTCLTCLVHGSVVPTWGPCVAGGILPSFESAFPCGAARCGAVVATSHEGRAPPVTL